MNNTCDFKKKVAGVPGAPQFFQITRCLYFVPFFCLSVSRLIYTHTHVFFPEPSENKSKTSCHLIYPPASFDVFPNKVILVLLREHSMTSKPGHLTLQHCHPVRSQLSVVQIISFTCAHR